MRIQPTLPLVADDPRYVERPDRPAERLSSLLLRGLAPIVLVGHAGLGKSTELGRALADLPEQNPGLLIQLADLVPERVLYDVATLAIQHWVQTGPEQQPSPFLVEDMRASDPSFPQGRGRTLPAAEICRAALDEMVGAYGVERITLCIDGVDRLEPEAAREVLLRLLSIRALADVVVVVGHGAVTGPHAAQVLDSYRVSALAPVDASSDEGAAFLVRCARAHLEDEEVDDALLGEVAVASGGVLRTLLTLVRDGRAYGAGELSQAGLDEAIGDQVERVRRLLCDGDRAVLAANDGTSGMEVPRSDKGRLLDQGLLLEYGSREQALTRANPLVVRLLRD